MKKCEDVIKIKVSRCRNFIYTLAPLSYFHLLFLFYFGQIACSELAMIKFSLP